MGISSSTLKKKSNLWIYAFGVGDVGAGRHNDTPFTQGH